MRCVMTVLQRAVREKSVYQSEVEEACCTTPNFGQSSSLFSKYEYYGWIADDSNGIHRFAVKYNLSLSNAQAREEFRVALLEFSGYIQRFLHSDGTGRVHLIAIPV